MSKKFDRWHIRSAGYWLNPRIFAFKAAAVCFAFKRACSADWWKSQSDFSVGN
ncbi:hypothetical protein [Treponema endosymbiont of Eucomonympha sp.]|uniref:hypothetical protein n=1 Tax=Treponema endosymbiont of Eucomonympha sp. TaxID=1580831 RepID=UPI000AC1FB16|nr:hypothetical protein [Treponema endosymbiont of Eucomonympha sp.]